MEDDRQPGPAAATAKLPNSELEKGAAGYDMTCNRQQQQHLKLRAISRACVISFIQGLHCLLGDDDKRTYCTHDWVMHE